MPCGEFNSSLGNFGGGPWAVLTKLNSVENQQHYTNQQTQTTKHKHNYFGFVVSYDTW